MVVHIRRKNWDSSFFVASSYFLFTIGMYLVQVKKKKTTQYRHERDVRIVMETKLMRFNGKIIVRILKL